MGGVREGKGEGRRGGGGGGGGRSNADPSVTEIVIDSETPDRATEGERKPRR